MSQVLLLEMLAEVVDGERRAKVSRARTRATVAPPRPPHRSATSLWRRPDFLQR
jgi:hypothetical protein